MIEEAIVAILLADSPTAAHVGTRVYGVVAPKSVGDDPFIVYRRSGGAPELTLSGDTGPDEAQIEIACWATTYDTVRAMAADVIAALHGYSGTSASINIGRIKLDGINDVFADEPENDQAVRFGRQLKFSVFIQ